jgi:hypothetical protein
LRRWGNRLQKDRETGQYLLHDGERFYRSLYFIPDPHSPHIGYLVCDGQAVRHSDAEPWRSSVSIQMSDGGIETLKDHQLAGYMARHHWEFVIETEGERQKAAQEAMQRMGIKISTKGYTQASVTEG